MGLLQAGARPRCVTWGLEASLRDERSDAAIARRLAREVGARHDFFDLDGRAGRAAEALERFVTLSEGQLPDFTMYADAFETWETLAARGLRRRRARRQPRLGLPRRVLVEPERAPPLRRRPRSTTTRPATRSSVSVCPDQSWPAELERHDGEACSATATGCSTRCSYRPGSRRSTTSRRRTSRSSTRFRRAASPTSSRRLPERLRLHPGAFASGARRPRPGRAVRRPGPRPRCSRSWRRVETREVIADGLRGETARRLFDAAGPRRRSLAAAEPAPDVTRGRARQRPCERCCRAGS